MQHVVSSALCRYNRVSIIECKQKQLETVSFAFKFKRKPADYLYYPCNYVCLLSEVDGALRWGALLQRKDVH